MSELAAVGDFCPNPECEDYGKIEAKTIIRYGKTREGRQRFQCKTCKQTFNERKGTMLYNRKTDEKDILECLVLLAEGTRISSISRWLQRSPAMAAGITDHLWSIRDVLMTVSVPANCV